MASKTIPVTLQPPQLGPNKYIFNSNHSLFLKISPHPLTFKKFIQLWYFLTKIKSVYFQCWSIYGIINILCHTFWRVVWPPLPYCHQPSYFGIPPHPSITIILSYFDIPPFTFNLNIKGAYNLYFVQVDQIPIFVCEGPVEVKM